MSEPLLEEAILIRATKGGGYRAVILVGRELSEAPGVKGSETSEGPWCEGRGKTPHLALSALYRAIGQAYIWSRRQP